MMKPSTDPRRVALAGLIAIALIVAAFLLFSSFLVATAWQ